MIKINEREEVTINLERILIEPSPEQYSKNYEFISNLRRESNHKAGYSGIRAKDCYVFSNS